MSGDRLNLGHDLVLVASAAAASLLEAGPAMGEVWRVIAASAYHDDPAAHDCYWGLEKGGTSYPFEGGINLATSAKSQLYTQIAMREALILGFGEHLRITSTVAMAAGKKLYMHIWYEVLRGVTN